MPVFQEITEAQMMPRIVRLGRNLYGAVFTLMKLLPARTILHNALRRGELGPDTVVVETTSGTFGLGLAMQAALLKRDLVLVSDPAIDVHLHRRLSDLGARVEVCTTPAPVGGFQEARLRRLAEIREEQPDTFCPEQYSNPDNPRSYAAVAELLGKALGQVDTVVGPVGSGGSMCGTVGTLRESTPHTRAIGVDTHNSVLFGQSDGPRPLRGLGNSLWPRNLDHTAFDEVHWSSAAEAFLATRQLHAQHALFQGPTSGAAFLAARWWAESHPDELCVVMLPDEGYRYQATVYDDRWLADNGFALSALPSEPLEVARPGSAGDRWTRMAWRRRSYLEVTGSAPGGRLPVAEAVS